MVKGRVVARPYLAKAIIFPLSEMPIEHHHPNNINDSYAGGIQDC